MSWIVLHPHWYLSEIELLNRHYPNFKVHLPSLESGTLIVFGELKVRPPGDTKTHTVMVRYQPGAPYEHPYVFPLKRMPNLDAKIPQQFEIEFFDRRHQMPIGNLCLFQRETRTVTGGDIIDILQVLRRAEDWFFGYHTGHWPPDTADSELESHFRYVSDVLLAERFVADEFSGHGRFYMIPDLRRIIDASPDYKDTCPMIVTAMTEESGDYQNCGCTRRAFGCLPVDHLRGLGPN